MQVRLSSFVWVPALCQMASVNRTAIFKSYSCCLRARLPLLTNHDNWDSPKYSEWIYRWGIITQSKEVILCYVCHVSSCSPVSKGPFRLTAICRATENHIFSMKISYLGQRAWSLQMRCGCAMWSSNLCNIFVFVVINILILANVRCIL